MKEGLRKVRGTSLATDIGEITLVDTFREGKPSLKQRTANTINCTSQQNTMPSLLRFMTLKKKSHNIGFIIKSKDSTIQKSVLE